MTDDLTKKISEAADEYYGAVSRPWACHFTAGAEFMRGILESELNDQIELVEEVSAQRAQLKLDLARLKADLALAKEALEFAVDSICRHGGVEKEKVKDSRQWCSDCHSWVYQSDLDGIKMVDETTVKLSDTGDSV